MGGSNRCQFFTQKWAYQLRHDADLHWLYTGEQKAKGRPRKFADKVRFDDLSRFELAGEIDGQRVYTALLFCTDIGCTALDILCYYKESDLINSF